MIIDRHKARSFAARFAHKLGVHFIKVFCTFVKYPTFPFMIALSVEREYVMVELDIKSAFLNGEQKEVIYLRPPHAMEISDQIILKLNNFMDRNKQQGHGIGMLNRYFKKLDWHLLTPIEIYLCQLMKKLN